MYDVAIVGGGPAGLTAGIFLGRYLRSVVLIDSGDPRNWETQGINGFLGTPKAVPAELRESGRKECRKYQVELVDAVVDRVEQPGDEHFRITLEAGNTFESRRLLLAYGLRDIWPRIPGLERIYGEYAHVCPDCDGYETRDRHTVVIGHGKRAASMALMLKTWTPHITVCTNGADAELDDECVDKLGTGEIPVRTDRITSLEPPQGDVPGTIRFNGEPALRFQKLFFNLGQYPADDLAHQLGCERDHHDQIVIDEAHHTSVMNVFAAGDITPGPQLAIRAAAGGAVAGLSIHRSLLADARRL